MTAFGSYEAGNDYLKAFVLGAICVSSFAPDGQASPPDFVDVKRGKYIHQQTAAHDLSFLSFFDDEGFVGTIEPIEDVSLVKSAPVSVLDDALAQVRGFQRLQDGWDGEGSKAPKPDVVSDAITVLQNWPESAGIPEPVLDVDGNISLELYTHDGYSAGGVELIGNNEAIYTLISGQALVASGAFNTKHQGHIIRAMEDLNHPKA